MTSAIILAGGKSRRMGRDKALLPYAGSTLLEHTVAILSGLVSEIIVVADVADKYRLSSGRVVADLFPDTGPVGGIVTGLTYADEGCHYVVACDMPQLNPDLLALLMRSTKPGVDAVVPEVEGLAEPLCGVYSRTAMPKLLGFLQDGGRSARESLAVLNVRRVGEEAMRLIDPQYRSFININTPEDLDNLRQV